MQNSCSIGSTSKLSVDMKRSVKQLHHNSMSDHELTIENLILDKSNICKDLSHLKQEEDDDETTTTVSCSEEEFSSSSHSSLDSCYNSTTVMFAEPLVTAVYYRPVTSIEDKAILHYNDADYRTFRSQYMHRKKTCIVRFPQTSVVTKVYEYPKADNIESLYYNESDLQRFLDDFMSSLNECFRHSLSK